MTNKMNAFVSKNCDVISYNFENCRSLYDNEQMHFR